MMGAMISMPWSNVGRIRAAAEAERARAKAELEKAQAGLAHAERQKSWVESIVAPISARYRENGFGRDVTITFRPRSASAPDSLPDLGH
jgi:hypothetical protein